MNNESFGEKIERLGSEFEQVWESWKASHPYETVLEDIETVRKRTGPRSTLTYYDFCFKPTVTFTVSSLRNCIEPQQWREIFLAMQRIGLGALKSMSHGQFKVTSFEQL